jgi:hypothetical protein
LRISRWRKSHRRRLRRCQRYMHQQGNKRRKGKGLEPHFNLSD